MHFKLTRCHMSVISLEKGAEDTWVGRGNSPERKVCTQMALAGRGGRPPRIQSLAESIYWQWQVRPGWGRPWQQLFCDISSISNERCSADSAAKGAGSPRGQCYWWPAAGPGWVNRALVQRGCCRGDGDTLGLARDLGGKPGLSQIILLALGLFYAH